MSKIVSFPTDAEPNKVRIVPLIAQKHWNINAKLGLDGMMHFDIGRMKNNSVHDVIRTYGTIIYDYEFLQNLLMLHKFTYISNVW